MNPKSSPSDKYAGKVLVGIYLVLIIWFSLLFIVGAHCRESSYDKPPKPERSWEVQLFLGSNGSGLSAELYFHMR